MGILCPQPQQSTPPSMRQLGKYNGIYSNSFGSTGCSWNEWRGAPHHAATDARANAHAIIATWMFGSWGSRVSTTDVNGMYPPFSSTMAAHAIPHVHPCPQHWHSQVPHGVPPQVYPHGHAAMLWAMTSPWPWPTMNPFLQMPQMPHMPTHVPPTAQPTAADVPGTSASFGSWSKPATPQKEKPPSSPGGDPPEPGDDDADLPEEVASSAGTSELRSMLNKRVKKDQEWTRPKSSLGSVRIEEYWGDRSRYQKWKRAIEAQQH